MYVIELLRLTFGGCYQLPPTLLGPGAKRDFSLPLATGISASTAATDQCLQTDQRGFKYLRKVTGLQCLPTKCICEVSKLTFLRKYHVKNGNNIFTETHPHGDLSDQSGKSPLLKPTLPNESLCCCRYYS